MEVRQATKKDKDAILAICLRRGKGMINLKELPDFEESLKVNISRFNVTTNAKGDVVSFHERQQASATMTMVNNKDKLQTRTEELDGVEYLVAPVVMVKEQVLNGEFLPAEEILKSTPGWNGRPVVVYHPVDDHGRDTIANQPDVVPKYEVGRIYNAVYEEDTTKLKAEIWIDISKAKRKNKDTREALDMIKNSEELEVSTGYIVNDRLIKKGEFDGVEYIAVQRDILPDHLALLPKEIGACSWEDGAGVRNNSGGIGNFFDKAFNAFKKVFNQQINIQQAVLSSIREFDPTANWVRDWINEDGIDYAIYVSSNNDNEVYTENSFKIAYEISEDGSVLLGNTVELVEPITQYIQKQNKKEDKNLKMKKNKQQLVRDVIANSRGKLGRKDTGTLMNLSEGVLKAMLPKSVKTTVNTRTVASKKPVTNAKETFKANAFKGRKFKTNEGEEVLVEELLGMTPEDVVATVEATPVEELELVAEVLVEVIEVADLVEAVAETAAAEVGEGTEEPAANDVAEEMTAIVEEVVAEAEEVLEVVEEAIAEQGGDSAGEGEEDPATNMDTDDITNPSEEEEEETVAALATARRRMRKNAKAATPKKKPSINEYIDGIPDPEAREFIKNGIREAKQHRNTLISSLSANKGCQFTEAELKKMETNALEKLAASIGGARHARNSTGSNFAARGIQTNNRQEENLGYTPLSRNIFNPKGGK